MTSPPVDVAGCVAGYAARLHGVIGTDHHVASPLGAWLLLALAAPAATGGDRDTLAEMLGCDPAAAAQAAADLLANPHPLVASAAAVWTQHGVELGDRFQQLQAGLPAAVSSGDLPGQVALDAWAREHTFGLVRRFPVQVDPSVYLVLASALATKVSWQIPFQLADASSLGESSPFAGQVSQVLRTPSPPEHRGHLQFVTPGGAAGDVILHAASAADGLVVVSLAALPDVPAAQVLALAHDLGHRQVTGQPVDRRRLADLPLGATPLWLVQEVSAATDTCRAVLPAWSAESAHSLTDPVLGFAAAKHALVHNPDPWTAAQSAMARYSRTGFEAAAVTALAVAASARLPSKRRAAELRFAHPYAVVAFAADAEGQGGGSGQPSPWHGLPVFSAWVARPEEAGALL